MRTALPLATTLSFATASADAGPETDRDTSARVRRPAPVRLGAIDVYKPRARRVYGLLKGRRTRFQAKRRTGRLTPATPVHRGEREIIARN